MFFSDIVGFTRLSAALPPEKVRTREVPPPIRVGLFKSETPNISSTLAPHPEKVGVRAHPSTHTHK